MTKVALSRALRRPWRLLWPVLRTLAGRGQVERIDRRTWALPRDRDLRWFEAAGPDRFEGGLLGFDLAIVRRPDGQWTATPGGQVFARPETAAAHLVEECIEADGLRTRQQIGRPQEMRKDFATVGGGPEEEEAQVNVTAP